MSVRKSGVRSPRTRIISSCELRDKVLETELECSEQAASALNQTPLQPQGKDLCHHASPEFDPSKMAPKSVNLQVVRASCTHTQVSKLKRDTVLDSFQRLHNIIIFAYMHTNICGYWCAHVHSHAAKFQDY